MLAALCMNAWGTDAEGGGGSGMPNRCTLARSTSAARAVRMCDPVCAYTLRAGSGLGMVARVRRCVLCCIAETTATKKHETWDTEPSGSGVKEG